MAKPTTSRTELVKGGGGWIAGMNSVRSPWLLPETQYHWGVNLLNRGGIPRTRSGFAHTLTFPSGEKLQGCTVFRARQFGDEATDYLVFAVDGNIYSLEFPLVQPSSWADHRLDITMSPDVDMIHMEVCEKTASTNPDGTAVVTPTFSTIIFNDGLSNAAAWDGTDVTIFDEDEQGVPTGTWMKFAGQRLWVAVGNVLVASDFADPYLFRERTSGTVRGDFVFDRDLTGLGISTSADRQEVLLAMTASTTEAFAVSRATRDDWETEGFRSMLYSNIGCVAGRTIIGHAGLTWWRAEEGLVNSDPATTVYVSSQIKTRDVELARSRARWNDDVSGCCSASYGGVFLTAFPYDDTLNSEIGVLDYAVVNEFGGEADPAWASVWTGIRPVEFCTRIAQGQKFIYAASVDYNEFDGSTLHLWEMFRPERRDSYLEQGPDGDRVRKFRDIYCCFDSALYGDGVGRKRIKHIDTEIVALDGDVGLSISYKGSSGVYNPASTAFLRSTVTKTASEEVNELRERRGPFLRQSRRLRSNTEAQGSDYPDYQPAEQDEVPEVSKAFSVRYEWCGSMAVESMVITMLPYHDEGVGDANIDERDTYRVLTASGITIRTPAPEGEAPEYEESEYRYDYVAGPTMGQDPRFYSSIPMEWSDNDREECLICSQNRGNPLDPKPLVIGGKTVS